MNATESTVPHAEYARMKAHYIKRTERLTARAERAEQSLAALISLHHRTITGSKKHDPENIDWRECDCKTCAAVARLLEGTEAYRAERPVIASDEKP